MSSLRASRLVLRKVQSSGAGSSSVFQNSRRWLHQRKELPYPIEEGLGSFMSPTALNKVAVEYQDGLLQRLNEQLKDSGHENQSVISTLLTYAGKRNEAMTFNYASEALNNSFFLFHMKPPNEDDYYGNEANISQSLLRRIETDFGSLAQLKSTVAATGLGMFGSGWVWLVRSHTGSLAVTATFAGGTMLIRGREQKGLDYDTTVLGEDANFGVTSIGSKGRSGGYDVDTRPANGKPKSTTSRQYSTLSLTNRSPLSPSPFAGQRAGIALSSDEVSKNDTLALTRGLTPLFCISIHEHSWMDDFGVWGKEEYLKRFWEVINWNKVSTNFLRLSKTAQDQQELLMLRAKSGGI